MSLNKRINKRWKVLIAVSLMFSAFAGILNNVMGVFYTPVSQSLNILRGSFALQQTIASLCGGLFSPMIPRLIKKVGWKKTLLKGLCLAFIGISGMAFFDNVIFFYILGAIRGVGAATFGMVPMVLIINNWFKDKNGMAISIASGFSGLVGMIFAPIFSIMISLWGRRINFILMGILLVLFCLPALLFKYEVTPEIEGISAYEDNESQKFKKTKMKDSNIFKIDGAIKISVICMMLFAILNTGILGINQHLPSYVELIGVPENLSGFIISAVMLGNILFKLLLGPLSDKIGAIKSTFLINGMNAVALVLLISSKNQYLIVMAAFMFGTVFSVTSVALPLLANQIFGKRMTEVIFPKLTLASSMGMAISNTMVGYIYDFTGGYRLSFVIGLVFQVVNVFTLMIAYKNSFKNNING